MNEPSRRIALSALMFFLVLTYFPARVYSQTVTATVPVGANPTFTAYDSSKGEVFVANYGAATVSVISDSSNTVVATVGVGASPFGVAYDSGKGEVFVANTGAGTVSVISDSSNTVVATVGVGTNPYGVVYDSGKGEVFVANYGAGTVSVISDSSNTVVATVGVGTNPEGVAYDSGKGEVFVTNINGNTVSVISDPTLTLAPSSGPSGSSTTLSGSSYLSSHAYSYCFESGVTSSPTTCSSTNQFTSDGSGNIPGSITLMVSGSTGLVVVSDPSTVTVTSSATFTITSPPPPPPPAPIMQCEYGGGPCHTSFVVFSVTESGKPAVGVAVVTLMSSGIVTQIQTTPFGSSTSPLCTNMAWTSAWGKYWGCLAGETGQFITAPGVVYTYSITLASGAQLKGTLIGPSPWTVEVVNV